MVTVNSDGKRGNNMSEKIESQTVTMAHGAGGKQTSELIDKVFAAHFANPDLTADDAAVLNPPVGKMAVSTDGFIVSPAFFPGGNIGKLSICGSVRQMAVRDRRCCLTIRMYGIFPCCSWEKTGTLPSGDG